MNRRFATSALAATLAFCLPGLSHAAASSPHGAATITTSSTVSRIKVKLISFHLRNETKAPLQLQMGEQQIVVPAGATASLKVPSGVQIVTVNATDNKAAGSVLSTVYPELQDNTLVVN